MSLQQGSSSLNPEGGGNNKRRRTGRGRQTDSASGIGARRSGYRQGSANLDPAPGDGARRYRLRQGSRNLNPKNGKRAGAADQRAKTLLSGAAGKAKSLFSAAIGKAGTFFADVFRRIGAFLRSVFRSPAPSAPGQGSKTETVPAEWVRKAKNILSGAGRGLKAVFGGIARSLKAFFSGAFRKAKAVFGGMSTRGIVLIAALGALLIWAMTGLIGRWLIPNVREKQAIESARSLVGATLAPGTEADVQLPADTPLPVPADAGTVTPSPLPSVPSATEVPAVAPNVTARLSANGLVYSPDLLEDYIALYAVNRDMGGWIRVRAIKNIDFPYVRGRNEYYITHDFYGGENKNGTAFLDETCKDWPRDKNLLIYAHNLKSGEMFGELNRLGSLRVIRSNPFVDCDSLYEKGVYIPVAVFVCSVDPTQEDYFDFHVSKFASREAFDAYIARCMELNRVNLHVDVDYSDDLLSLVTCYDEEGIRRFVAVCRRLRPDETEASVLEKYFR